MIYRWYKIPSPHIDVAVDGIAFDERHLRLYVSLHQRFKLRVVPFYNAPAKLATVLQLTTDPTPAATERGETLEPVKSAEVDAGRYKNGNGHRDASRSTGDDEHWRQEGDHVKAEYWIQSQNDLYQTTEWIKFLVPWGIGVFLLLLWQLNCTLHCVAGTKVYDSLNWGPRKLYRQQFEAFDNGDKEHPHLGAD